MFVVLAHVMLIYLVSYVISSAVGLVDPARAIDPFPVGDDADWTHCARTRWRRGWVYSLFFRGVVGTYDRSDLLRRGWDLVRGEGSGRGGISCNQGLCEGRGCPCRID